MCKKFNRNNQEINLYVDDMRDCPKGFEIARDYDEAINKLDKYDINILSLDHDLGINAEGVPLLTGYDLVLYFCKNGLHANKIFIHTDNPVGRKHMLLTLKRCRDRGFISKDIKIYHFPYSSLKKDFL